MTTGHRPLCSFEAWLGRLSRCPADACPLWEPGGAALPGGCLLERVGADLAGGPDVAALLLDLRSTLEAAQSQPEPTASASSWTASS